MSKVKCKACSKVIPRAEWEVHDCPMTPKPKPGERWEDYKARCEKYRAAKMKEKNG